MGWLHNENMQKTGAATGAPSPSLPISGLPADTAADAQSAYRAALEQWMSSFPAESLNKLRLINTSSGSARHVVLSLAFGLCDSHIRRINCMITSLLLARLKAERCNKVAYVSRINNLVKEIHAAIDNITGTGASAIASDVPCNRTVRMT